MGIEPLPPEVRSYLRTGVAITSVNQCVEELVLNSLDAGATCVAVRLDLSSFKVQVVDNGSGVSHDQLDLIGNRFCTSKCHGVSDLQNLCHFGYRGEALASIRDSCGVLDITTRTRMSSQTYCKLFQQGKSLKVAESKIARPSTGTTVTVHELFMNFPVRQKSLNKAYELEKIRETLESIALIRPGISCSVRNDITGQMIFQTRKCSDCLSVFAQLYGPAKSEMLQSVEGTKGVFKLTGFIGRDGYSRKNLQFVYINGRLVKKSQIHKTLNKILANLPSLNPKFKQPALSPEETRQYVFKSPPKFSEVYPVYIIQVTCPISEYDITFEPAKTMVEFKDWDTVLSCVEKVTKEFVKEQTSAIAELRKLESPDARVERKAENRSEENITVIAPENLKDVVISKAVRKKPNDAKNIQENDRFRTPETGSHVMCKEAIGLGNRTMDASVSTDVDSTQDTIIDQSKNTIIDTDDASIDDTCRNTDRSCDKSKTSFINKGVAVSTVETKCNEISGKNDKVFECGSVKFGEMFSRLAQKACSSSTQGSLSKYKQSIGKFGCKNTEKASVEDSLKKLQRIMPQVEKNVNSKNVFSSLQQFRKRAETTVDTDSEIYDRRRQCIPLGPHWEQTLTFHAGLGQFRKQKIKCTKSSEGPHVHGRVNGNIKPDTESFQHLGTSTGNEKHTGPSHCYGREMKTTRPDNNRPIILDSEAINEQHAAENQDYQKAMNERVAYNIRQTFEGVKEGIHDQRLESASVPVQAKAHDEMAQSPPFRAFVLQDKKSPLNDVYASYNDTDDIELTEAESIGNVLGHGAPSVPIDTEMNPGCSYSKGIEHRCYPRKRGIPDGNSQPDVNQKYMKLSEISRNKDVKGQGMEIERSEAVCDPATEKCNIMSDVTAQCDVQILKTDASNKASDTNVCDMKVCDHITNVLVHPQSAIAIHKEVERNGNLQNCTINKSGNEKFGVNINPTSMNVCNLLVNTTKSVNIEIDVGNNCIISEMNARETELADAQEMFSTQPFIPCIVDSPDVEKKVNEKTVECLESVGDVGTPGSMGFTPKLDTSVSKNSTPCSMKCAISPQKLHCNQAGGNDDEHGENMSTASVNSRANNDLDNCKTDKEEVMVDKTDDNHVKLKVKSSFDFESMKVTQDTNEHVGTYESSNLSQLLKSVSQRSDDTLRSTDITHNGGDDELDNTLGTDVSICQPDRRTFTFQDLFDPSQTPVCQTGAENWVSQPKVSNCQSGSHVICQTEQKSSACQMETHQSFDKPGMQSLVCQTGMLSRCHDKVEMEKANDDDDNNDQTVNSSVFSEADWEHNVDSLEAPVNRTEQMQTTSRSEGVKGQSNNKLSNHEEDFASESFAKNSNTEKDTDVCPCSGTKTFMSHKVIDVENMDTFRPGDDDENSNEMLATKRNSGLPGKNSSFGGLLDVVDTKRPQVAGPSWKQDNEEVRMRGIDYGDDSGDDADCNDDRLKDEDFDKNKWRNNDIKPSVNIEKLLQQQQVHIPVPDFLQKKPCGDTTNQLSAVQFSKQSLSNVQVLGQLDKKFIACLFDTDSQQRDQDHGVLVLVDQHAAHERVRLEVLTEESFVNGEKGGYLVPHKVDPPHCLQFTENEVRNIEHFIQHFIKIGLSLSKQSPTSVSVSSVPECLLWKKQEVTKIYWDTIKVLIREHLSVFMTTRGAQGIVPQTVHKILCSQACHGAIKFGDRLSSKECCRLIHDLSNCDLPFQCAHGRPSVMPLLQLDQLEALSSKPKSRPQLWKIKKAVKGEEA